MTGYGALDQQRQNVVSRRRHLISGVIAGIIVIGAAALMLAGIIWPMTFALP